MGELCKECVGMGYEVAATEPLANSLADQRIACRKADVKEAHDILEKHGADYLICIPSRKTRDRAYESGDHYVLRRRAVDYSIPVTTEIENARMLVRGLAKTEAFTMHAYSELPHSVSA